MVTVALPSRGTPSTMKSMAPAMCTVPAVSTIAPAEAMVAKSVVTVAVAPAVTVVSVVNIVAPRVVVAINTANV